MNYSDAQDLAMRINIEDYEYHGYVTGRGPDDYYVLGIVSEAFTKNLVRPFADAEEYDNTHITRFCNGCGNNLYPDEKGNFCEMCSGGSFSMNSMMGAEGY